LHCEGKTVWTIIEGNKFKEQTHRLFRYDNFKDNGDLIFHILTEIVTTPILISNKHLFNDTYDQLMLDQPLLHAREELEMAADMISSACVEISRAFTNLIGRIIPARANNVVIFGSMSLSELEKKIGASLTKAIQFKDVQTQNLIIESVSNKGRFRQLLIIQNAPHGITKEIEAIKRTRDNFFVLILNVNSRITENIIAIPERQRTVSHR
jgi:hypothetical protein